MLKIRSSPIVGEQNEQARQCAVEKEAVKFQPPVTSYGNRNSPAENSPQDYNSNSGQPPLPTLDLPNPEHFFQKTGRKASLYNHCAQMTLH